MDYLYIGETRVGVERKKIKNLNLRIRRNGDAVISVPISTRDSVILSFLTSKTDWIAQKQETVRKAALHPSPGRIFLWGKEVAINITIANRGKNALEITDGGAFLTLKSGYEGKEREVLRLLLAEKLRAETEKRLKIWEGVTGLKASSFSIRNMTSRWGSCNIRTKKLTFSLRLIEKPTDCLDYVIVHELVHIKEANHGDGFKRAMDMFFPLWRETRKRLK